ncbi:peptidoglycan D,D-transpeptidase FtsI family protein [Pseudogracilibacillus sp. SO30301A]|uniref:peptidoglycan D,D-transpeptidase FtsI family protein n=1 Tax=Pseudogracilibacillus sp. SO30301A TaxID=3098291 RepID=UPI00300DDAD5
MVNKKKNVSRIPLRINIIFFVVFILFSVLVVQLGVVQILQGESFQKEIDRTIKDISRSPVPRGKIFDRNGEIVVDNKPLYSITYTPPKRVQAEDKLKLAEELTNFLIVDDKVLKKITERNKKEYWYLKNIDKAVERLTDKEKEELDDIEQYDLMLKRITDEEIANFTDDQLQVIAIKRELDKAYSLTPEVIKNKDISVQEYAEIAENLSELPGINASTDWERKYVYGDTLKSIIGSITSQEQGIPAEKEDYYLTRGYNRNDRVGKSGLEEQYEDVLRGRKEQVQYTTTKNGDIIGSDIIVPGERGKDLVLAMDMEYQELVDEIVLKELKAAKSSGNHWLEDALAVVMNPKTGEILALSGQHYDRETGEYKSTPHKVLYDAHRPGSTVKGATVLAGLQSGVINPGDVFYDSPIQIAQTPRKASYARLGAVDDTGALKRSSNVYMFYIALRLGGDFRHPFPNNASTSASATEGLQKMRNYFNQFGLGIRTGIDFPFESTGFVGTDPKAGNLMDNGIGQYDTYTTLQLAQYVSTIANDGYRVEPRFVKEIRNPSNNNELGSVDQVIHPKVLNKIDVNPSYIERVQTGFWKAFNESGGTGHKYWAGTSYRAAGKTGTAENEVYLKRDDGTSYKAADVENLSLVGYAPYDDPEVAFAVIVPQLGKNTGNQINHKIGRGLLDTYFELKEKRSSEKNKDDEE